MCDAYNLYGPGDNFNLQSSHVLPALIRKAHEAKLKEVNEIVISGSGTPQREFLHVDDLAEACIFLMKKYLDFEHINVGSDRELTILELTQLVCSVVGFRGSVIRDTISPTVHRVS